MGEGVQHVYAYMDVGGRATQEQLPSSPVLPAWLCEIIAPAHPALAIFVHTPQGGTEVHARQLTKGAAISSLFHYASQANTTAWMQELERIRRQSRELLYTLSNCGFKDNE